MYVCNIQRGQKAVGSLELDLQMFVNCYVGAGNQIWGFWKSSQGA